MADIEVLGDHGNWEHQAASGATMSTDTTHRCIAAEACREPQVIDGTRHGALTEKPHTLCDTCLTSIQNCVRQLPRDWSELRRALGERATTTGQRIKSTPTPAIPISTRKEALMGAIVEATDRAAAIVADALNTEQPTGRRNPPPGPEGKLAREGSIVADTAESVRPNAQQVLTAAIAITEPNIDLLAAAPEQPALIWKSPYRCDFHADWIEHSEAELADALNMSDTASPKKVRAYLREQLKTRKNIPPKLTPKAKERLDLLGCAYHDAGVCEDCGGWCKDGQARELTELSGLDIALQLVELHHQTRAELGKTRLRHRYPMPCPRCGGRVGRDDGDAIVTCDDRTNCKSSWTEREYQFLAGLITRERLDMEILKYLLAEAYSRLDNLREAADIMRRHDNLDADGKFALNIIDSALGDHKKPADRVIATDRKTTEQRQTTEDTWTWQNERPYQPPKRKPRKATRPTGAPIHPSSLSTLVDSNPVESVKGHVCTECRTVHAGECP